MQPPKITGTAIIKEKSAGSFLGHTSKKSFPPIVRSTTGKSPGIKDKN